MWEQSTIVGERKLNNSFERGISRLCKTQKRVNKPSTVM